MLNDNIRNDLNFAMKAREVLRVSVLRMLISEINYKKIDLQRDLTDEDVVGVIQKEVKKRREAIEAFSAGGRPEQAETEQKELEMLMAYLPAQVDEKEIQDEVIKLMGRLSDEEKSNFGQVMRVVSPVFKGKADGRVVADIVKKILSN